LPALAWDENVDGTAECLENLQYFSDLSRGLARFEIDNEPNPDPGNAGKFVLT
jgi:hypothetical protein